MHLEDIFKENKKSTKKIYQSTKKSTTYSIQRKTSLEDYTSVILGLYKEKKNIQRDTPLWLKDIYPLLRTQWKLRPLVSPRQDTWPFWHLILHMAEGRSGAWAPRWRGLDEGENRSTRQAEQQGRCSYTGEGDSSSNANSKKAEGTNKSLLNPLPTNAESWLSQTLKPQIATLNFPNFLKF